jgi:hypothetical protein
MDSPAQNLTEAKAEEMYSALFGTDSSGGGPADQSAPGQDAESQAEAQYRAMFGGAPVLNSGSAGPEVTALGHAARETIANLGPGAAAAVAFAPGMKAGAAIGALVPGLGETGISEGVGGLVGGVVSSALAAGSAAWAQHKAAQALVPEATRQFNELEVAGEEQHPLAGAVGRIASALPAFEFAPLQSVKGLAALVKGARGAGLNVAEKESAKALAAQVGLGTGQAAVTPFLFGESPTRQGLVEAFVQSLILGQPRYGVFGRHAAEGVAKEEAAKDKLESARHENQVDHPGEAYKAPPVPGLTDKQRGELSALAGRATTGAPMAEGDGALHALMADNDPARKFFDAEKKRYSTEIAQRLALASQERDAFGDAKGGGESDYVGGELPHQSGFEIPATEQNESSPTETAATARTAQTQTEQVHGSVHDAERPGEEPAPATDVVPIPTVVDSGAAAGKALQAPEDELVSSIERNPLESVPHGTPPSEETPAAAAVPGKPAWAEHQGDPAQLVEQFRRVMESGKVDVAEQKNRAGIFTDLAGLDRAEAKELVYKDKRADANAGAQSRKLVAMQSPDGTHVVVGVASETTSNGKRTAKVATYDIGAGRKSPHATSYASGYDRMLELGWKPLASMKSDIPLKGHFATYSTEQWHEIASGLQSIKAKAQSTYEAVSAGLEAAPEFGRAAHTINQDTATPAEIAEHEDNAGITHEVGGERVGEGSTDSATASHYEVDRHSQVLWDVLDERKPETPEEAISAIGADPDARRAFALLLADSGIAGEPRLAAAELISRLHEQYQSSRTSYQAFEDAVSSEVLGQSGRQTTVAGDPVREGRSAPTGGESGGSGIETRGSPHETSGAGDAAEPTIRQRSAEEAAADVTPPEVKVVDKDGIGPKELTKLQAIAEQIAEGLGHEGRDAIEAAADEILDSGQSVKVDGKSALLHNGLVYTQEGTSFVPKVEVSEALTRFRRSQAVTEIEHLRPSAAKTGWIAREAIGGLRALGVRVDVVIDPLAKHFSSGEYKELVNGKGNAVRVITWTVADAHNPSGENLVALFHEAFHAVFARETPELQAAGHRAVKAFTDEALGIQGFREAVAATVPIERRPDVEQEGRLAEALGRKLVAEGFNPAEASGAVQRLWRVVSDIYQGTLMGLQKVAGYPISKERAMAYFENRLKMALAGEKPMSFLNYLGGPRKAQPNWDTEGEATRHSGLNPVTNPRKYLETPEGAPVGVAALNHFMDAIREQIHQWDVTGNLAGLTDDEIARHFIKLPEKVGESEMFVNEATPQRLIDQAVKTHGVSPDTRIADLPNSIAKQRAAAVAHRLFDAWKAAQSGAAMEARKEWRSSAHELDQNQKRLLRLTKDYRDLDYMDSVSREAMLHLLDDLSTSIRGVRDFSHQAGMIEQTLRQVEQLQTGELPPPYRRALDGVYKLLAENDPRFSDTLQKVASLDIDWTRPTGQVFEAIRQAFLAGGHEYLAPFLSDNVQSKALLATITAFGKSNSHIMDMLAIRGEKLTEEHALANEFLKELLGAGRGDAGELRERINSTFKSLKMRDRMVRIADKFAELKKRNYDLQASVESNQAKVDFHEDVFKPLVEAAMNGLERTAGIQLKSFEVYHGAEVPVPAAASSAPDKFDYRMLALRTDIGKKGIRPTPTPEVVSWMKAMQDWVDNAENQRFGAKYNEVSEALGKLKNHYVADEHRNLSDSLATRMLGPLQEKCNQAGTAAARLCGQAFNRYSALSRARMREVTQQGTHFGAALNEARKACGFPASSEATFWDNVVAPAFHDLEQNGERFWASGKTVEGMVEKSIEHALDFMDLKNPKARAAVGKLLRQHIDNSRILVRNGEELGNKVLDQGEGYRVYRKVLGTAPFTLPRVLTDIAQNFYREHMGGWTGDSLKPEAIEKAYSADPDALRETLKSRFTPQVWNWFMKSLAYNDRSYFYAPTEDSIRPLASREKVIQAYDTAEGDPVRFAENLANLHGYRPDGAFVADTLDTVQNFHNLLRAMVGEEFEAIRGGSPAPKRFIVDARHIEAAPKEWLNYLMSDHYNMEKVIHAQAFQAGFGRNGAAMERNLAAAINDQQGMLDRYNGWREAILKENPGISEKLVQRGIKDRCGLEGISYTALKESRNNLATLNGVADAFKAIQGMNNSGIIPELQPWARLIRTIGGWTVSGAGTAITAHSVFLEQPTRLLGLNVRSLALTGRSLVDAAKVAANAMLQAVGRECVFDADRLLAANQVGLFDTLNTNRQRLVTAWTHAYAAYRNAGPMGQAVGRAAELGSAVLQSDVFAPGAREKAIQRQAEGKAVAPTMKVLSPFHFAAECLQISNFITWQRHIEGMVSSGVLHFVEHPELVEDAGFRFDRKNLSGFGAGEREFNFLTERMSNFGFSLEQLAREAYRNRGSDKPILSAEVNKAISQLTLNEITLESSLTSRLPLLQTNGLGVAMNPFLGWPLQKTYQVLRELREPNGLATAKAFRGGLAAYMAILPIGMAASWLRNKFDEEVLGRKMNVSDLGNIHDLKSGLMTALDNASRIGTFGFIGEGLNYTLNDDNVRPITLDNRIFFANTIQNVWNAARALLQQTAPQVAQGNFQGALETGTDYQTVLRPLFQTLGGNGLLQNLGALNHLLSIDDAEARVSNRISVNNYLRVAGRELGLDVRTFGGMLQNQSIPNPIKPFIGRMVLSAYANDHESFSRAMKDALRQARAEGMKPEEAMKKVVSMFEAQNPLRIVFKSPPTEGEYSKLLTQLPDSGRQSVTGAVALYQHYAAQIGANTSVYSRDKGDFKGGRLSGPAGFGRVNRVVLTLEDMKRGAVGLGYHQEALP